MAIESTDEKRATDDVAIRARDLTKTYNSRSDDLLALDNVDLTVYDGEIFCLLGPSGCGKSTLLRIIGDLLEWDSGSLEIRNGGSGDRPETSMVFQEHGIFPWKSVMDNVAFGLKMRGVDQDRRYEIARRYIEKVNLSGFEDAYPHELSGGMKQRVGIARAFANDPKILLMDEPFGALDAQTKEFLQRELLSLWQETKKTVVYVTHDIEEAIYVGDRLGVMTARPGKIKETIDVDLDRPRTRDAIQQSAVDDIRGRVWDILEGEVERSIAESAQQ